MAKDIDEMTNAEKYVQLFNEMQMSLAQAKTEQEKNKIRQNFERDTQDFSGTDLAKASRMIDAMREGKADGGFPDLNKDGKLSYADVLKGRGAFAKGSLLSSLEMSLEKIDDEAIVKLTGKDPSPESRKKASEILKFMSEAGEAILELDSSKKPTTRKGISEYNKKQKELTKKVDKLKKDLGTYQFNSFKYQILRDAGRVEKNEGSLMVAPEREAYGKGKLIKEVAPKVVDIFERLVGPKTVAKKKKMVDEEQALREIQKVVDKDPQALEALSDEDYMEVVSRLPQKQRSNFGLDDAPQDDIVEMALQMEPEEVAKNLELFGSMEDMFEYAGALNAQEARKFMEALSPADKEIFAGELPEFQLGPREVKADGGSMAILMPVEYEEQPKDTYNNISSKEEKEEVKNMNSDGEMEEEYIDYVANEVLSKEEQDYLFKALDEDNKLEEILDKVMLNATEFTGSGEVDGPGTGVSDSIPARLSDGEFVFTRKATDQIGADNLQKMMDDAEREFDQRNGKAEGGMPVEGMERYDMEKDDEDTLQRQMAYANRMPSLMNR